MKCPECGYTSFESYDSCIRCSADMTAFKQNFGIKPFVLPRSVRESMANAAAEDNAGMSASGGNTDNLFAFDTQEESMMQRSGISGAADRSPFSFDDIVPPNRENSPAFSFDLPASVLPDDDPFADLLGSSSTLAKPDAAPPAADGDSHEFESGNFSWDDSVKTGDSAQSAVSLEKSPDDDLNSLFGDSKR